MSDLYSWIDHLTVEIREDGGWYICRPTNEIYAGPYKTQAGAKGQLTRLRNGYTPAARRPS